MASKKGSVDKYCHCLFEGGSRGAEDLILPGTGGAGSRPNIRGLNVAVSYIQLFFNLSGGTYSI